MMIRWKTLIGAFVLVGATTMITSQVVSQNDKGDREAQVHELWQEWMKYAQPGPEHAGLARLTGNWSHENTHWMYPGAEPQKMSAVAEYSTILDGRYVIEKVRGQHDFDGQAIQFEGVGLLGYDNIKRKHVFVWVDNMSTMIMTGEGTADETGRVITYLSELPNPMTGGTSTYKSVSRIVSDDENVFEMYEKQPDGSWFKNLEIVATRQ